MAGQQNQMADSTRFPSGVQRKDQETHGKLIDSVYQELRRLAAYHLKGERANHTLQPTALVNEAYDRLFGTGNVDVNDRQHLMALFGRCMRHVLIDHAKKKKSKKRGGVEYLDTEQGDGGRARDELERGLIVAQVVERLEEEDPRLAKIIEMRFLAGMTEVEIGRVLDLSARQIIRECKVAKALFENEAKHRAGRR